MASDEESSGFLSRWSRRKTDVREGRVLAEPTPPVAFGTASSSSAADLPAAHAPEGAAKDGSPQAGVDQPPAPSLADVQQLTPESDFTGFMARGVAPDVKNAAMKKLFSDPHFNVMDRMDIYIDDYTQPDPLPLAMLRQMVSAKTLNLFDDETDPPIAGDTPPSAEAEKDKVEPKST